MFDLQMLMTAMICHAERINNHLDCIKVRFAVGGKEDELKQLSQLQVFVMDVATCVLFYVCLSWLTVCS